MSRPLKVGFDLDGVLLYNPARIARLPVTLFKHAFFKKRSKKFIIPKNPLSKFIWKVAHWTSLFIAPGFNQVERMVKNGKIEAYIISGRYGFLGTDFQRWVKKLNKKAIFTEIHYNKNNEQPHLYKEKVIKKLNLDVFIEDNWDIVEYLSKKTPTKIFWVYNIFDRNISHSYKFPGLKKAVERLKRAL